MKPIKYITIILGVILAKDSFSQTYVPNKTGVKMVSLEGCIKKIGGAPCDSCFMFTDKFGKFGKCMHISEIRAMIDTSYAQDSVIIINNATGTYSLKNEYGTYYEFGYKFTQVGDTLFLTDLDGTKTDTAIITAGGATTNTLNLSGNTLTSTVNAVADTSLVIGTHILSLSGNSMTSNTNGITDTSLVIGTHVLSLSGNTMTTNTNGITDTSLVIGLVNGNLATNTITLNVNGVTDTVLVIGRATLNLAGNQITVNVNGVTDTTLVIGTVSNTSSTNSLTTTVNGVAGSSVNIINSNTNSLSGNTITGSVNGVSDTVLVIGRNTLNLSGNEITTNVNGVTDTTLVIGVNTIGLSGNTITSSVNGKSDTTLAVGVNSLSYGTGTGILTSSVNGVSDTTTITPVSGQGGIYGGSGVVYNNAMAEIGSASATDNFGLGHFAAFPNYTDYKDYGLIISTASGIGAVTLNAGDSVNQIAAGIVLNGDIHISTSNSAFTEYGALEIWSNSAFVDLYKFKNGNESQVRLYGDSMRLTTPQLNLKINNSYGVNGYVLTSNGTSASWQSPPSGLLDADYGDITVSGGGTVMTIDANAVTSSKIAANTINQTDVDDDFIWINGGNIKGTTMSIGTNDAFDFYLRANATNMMRVKSAGGIEIGGSTGSSSTTYDWLTIYNNRGAGAPSNGFGSAIFFQGESSTTDQQDMGRITSYWTNVTHVNREAAIGIELGDNASVLAETFKFDRVSNSSGAFSIGSSNTTVITNADFTPTNNYTFQIDNAGSSGKTITIKSTRTTPTEESNVVFHPDSITFTTDQFRVISDTLTLKINGSHGTSGQMLVSDGYLATWTTKQLTGSASLNFASTAAQGSSDLTITVTGASVGDVVSLGVPNGSVMANTCYTAWVSSSNTVNVRFNNYSSSSSDPSSGTFNVIVHK